MDNIISTHKVSWNTAEGLVMEISNRRSMANTHYISGNISKAFSTLVSIKQSVIQSFNKEEREKLYSIEEEFKNVGTFLALSAANSFNPKVREAHKLSKRIGEKVYHKYNECLMDLLNKYGYLIGQKADASRMKF